MQAEIPDIAIQIVLIATLLILFFGGSIIYFLFLYQRKRFRHEADIKTLKDAHDKMLMQSKIEIQEQTLDHIGKEIHSNIMQIASLTNVNLQVLERETEGAALKNVLETKGFNLQLIAELKALNVSFNTDVIMKMGLENALEKELKRIKKIKHSLDIKKSEDYFRLPPEEEIVLFRLCQEVFNNAIIHAKASCIKVVLDYSNRGLELCMEDDGVGFDLETIEEEHGTSSGLLNMKKRASFFGGEVKVVSTPGVGTKVFVSIPKNSISAN